MKLLCIYFLFEVAYFYPTRDAHDRSLQGSAVLSFDWTSYGDTDEVGRAVAAAGGLEWTREQIALFRDM